MKQYFNNAVEKNSVDPAQVEYIKRFLVGSGVVTTGKETEEELLSMYSLQLSYLEARFIEDEQKKGNMSILKEVGTVGYEKMLEKALIDFHTQIGVEMPKNQYFVGSIALLSKLGAKAVKKVDEKRALKGKPPVIQSVLSGVKTKIADKIHQKREIIASSTGLERMHRDTDLSNLSAQYGDNRATADSQADLLIKANVDSDSKLAKLIAKGKDAVNQAVGGYKESETAKAKNEFTPYLIGGGVLMLVLGFVFGRKL
jgi:hypothetical protein